MRRTSTESFHDTRDLSRLRHKCCLFFNLQKGVQILIIYDIFQFIIQVGVFLGLLTSDIKDDK
jgi:hypothetical protein